MSRITVPEPAAVQVREKSLEREIDDRDTIAGFTPASLAGAVTVPEKLPTPLESPAAVTPSVSPAIQASEDVVVELTEVYPLPATNGNEAIVVLPFCKLTAPALTSAGGKLFPYASAAAAD
jgi:hypothetical protein